MTSLKPNPPPPHQFDLPPKSTPSQRVSAIVRNYKPNNSNFITSTRPPPPRVPPPPPPPLSKSHPPTSIKSSVTRPPSGAGIIPRVVRTLFSISRRYTSINDDVKITFCFIQLYNEKISDLLQPPSSKPTVGGGLQIREDPNLGVFIPGATQVMATSTKGVLAVLRAAAKQRAVRRTGQNEFSSRSHAVLRFTVTRCTEDKDKPGMSKVRRGTLTFVDLAGSERIFKSRIDKIRPAVNEARQINKSISSLGNVIKALAKNSGNYRTEEKEQHVPFRDSKLTRILTETLSGKAACVLIANLSNQIDNAEEVRT